MYTYSVAVLRDITADRLVEMLVDRLKSVPRPGVCGVVEQRAEMPSLQIAKPGIFHMLLRLSLRPRLQTLIIQLIAQQLQNGSRTTEKEEPILGQQSDAEGEIEEEALDQPHHRRKLVNPTCQLLTINEPCRGNC